MNLCLVRRVSIAVFGLVALALTVGVIPHPTVRMAQAMMYVALALAIVALGAAWRPKGARTAGSDGSA